MSSVVLRSAEIEAVVDLDRGAEIASVRHTPTGTDILMVTPWADRARTLRPVDAGYPPEESEAVWLSSYAGGWQTLFPHVGAPEKVDDDVRQYHGEASIVPWVLDRADPRRLECHVDLASVPARVNRIVTVEDSAIRVEDRIRNFGHEPIRYDYQSHPAFGAPFLEPGCRIVTDAQSYTPHAGFDLGELPPGRRVDWPGSDAPGGGVDLSRIPDSNAGTLRFGWLGDFTDRAVTITNPRLGLSATLVWNDTVRDVAWLWQDSGADTRDPWAGRGYVTAIEPSTRTTSFGERTAPILGPDSHVEFITRLSLHANTPAAKEHAQ